jgi:hypothetical protein
MSFARGLMTVATIVLGILLVARVGLRVFERLEAEHAAAAEIEVMTDLAVARIDGLIRSHVTAVEVFAAELSARPVSDKRDIFARMTRFLEENPGVYGSTISYVPGKGFVGTGRYAPYGYRDDSGNLTFIQLDREYDYETKDWFTEPLKSGNRWTEPYFDSALQKLMITYSACFTGADDAGGESRAIGVVTIDITMDQLVEILEAIDLGPSGYPALTTASGRYLYHPNSEYVAMGRTLAEIGRASGDASRIALVEKARNGARGGMDHRSVTTGRSAWLFYAPIPSTGWSLQNTFTRDAILIDADANRRSIVEITALAVLFCMAAAGLMLRVENGEIRRVRRFALLLVIVLIAGIGVIWKSALDYPPSARAEKLAAARTTAVVSRSSLARVEQDFVALCRDNNLQPPSFVPTGIYIDAIRFESPNDIVLSGHLWQKYSLAGHAHLQRGVAFPGAEYVELVEVYKGRQGGDELVRWRFSVSIRAKMDYTRYPIDEGVMRFMILHKDLNHNVVLVPDLASYRILTPTLLPGIAPGAFAPGWIFRSSNFSLVRQARPTSFGEQTSVSKENFPALAFDIRTRRDFVNAFITSLTSLLIVSIMLFTILCVAHQIDIGRFISICVGMFFVITFNHLDLRRRIAAEEIFYLEWFFFLVYALILGVSIVAIFVHRNEKPWCVAWRNNMIAKLLYWPILAGTVFLATALYFG